MAPQILSNVEQDADTKAHEITRCRIREFFASATQHGLSESGERDRDKPSRWKLSFYLDVDRAMKWQTVD